MAIKRRHCLLSGFNYIDDSLDSLSSEAASPRRVKRDTPPNQSPGSQEVLGTTLSNRPVLVQSPAQSTLLPSPPPLQNATFCRSSHLHRASAPPLRIDGNSPTAPSSAHAIAAMGRQRVRFVGGRDTIYPRDSRCGARNASHMNSSSEMVIPPYKVTVGDAAGRAYQRRY